MINFIRPSVDDLKEIKRDRLLWIRKSLENAIQRLPGNACNDARRKSIEEIDEKLKR